MLFKREEEFSDRLNNRATFDGFTALHYAVLADSILSVKALLEGGADPTLENSNGHRPIDYTKNSEIIEVLNQYAFKFEEAIKEQVFAKFLKII